MQYVNYQNSYFKTNKNMKNYNKRGITRLLLDLELSNIRELIKRFPNDADLGEMVRMLYNK